MTPVISYQYQGITFLVSRALGGSSDDLGPLNDGTNPNPGEIVVDAIGDVGCLTVSLAGAVADAASDPDPAHFAELATAVTALELAESLS